ncbi:MAG: hypothetical protein INR64_12160, partial [Caulobacteraceae bacterium]|nr:hypothetical protein [Caulobacter sp.]
DQAGEVAGRASPAMLFEGAYQASPIDAAVDALQPPRKLSGAFADTDFAGAFAAARQRLLGGGEGVVWIVTNNKNSPDNSAEVKRNTQRFYAELANDPRVARIAGFLVRMPAQGRVFSEKGLVVYAVAVGDDAARALDLIVSDASPLRQGLFRGNPPLRLKPLTRQALELTIDRSRADDGASAYTDRNVLVVRGVKEGRPGRLELEGSVRNALYPYRIEQATMTPVWTRFGAGDGGQAQASITPTQLRALSGAGAARQPVRLDLVLPPLRARDLLQGGATSDGMLEIRLSDVRLAFDPAFVERAQGVFGGDVLTAAVGQPGALPDLFYRGRDVREATTRLPVRMIVEFAAWPIWLIFGGVALVFLAIVSVWVQLGRPVRFTSRLLGREVMLRRAREVLPDASGRRVEIARRLFGAPRERYMDEDAG